MGIEIEGVGLNALKVLDILGHELKQASHLEVRNGHYEYTNGDQHFEVNKNFLDDADETTVKAVALNAIGQIVRLRLGL